MAAATTVSMCDARDAEDKRLLETGEIDLLLAGWLETIVARCVAKMRDADVGNDVAQAVCERLWRELKAGRHRDGLPFRVIVHKVVDWTCAGWFEERWREHELLDGDGAGNGDFTGEVVLQLTLESFVATLPPVDGEVARLSLLEHLGADQIAARLGKEPNAVYQARHRVMRRLREWLEA